MKLIDSIEKIKGIGPKKKKEFKKMGIETIEDLICFYPRTYQDRTKIKKISDCRDGEYTGIIAKVIGNGMNIRVNNRNLIITKVSIENNGVIGEAIWYNKPFMKNILKIGKKYYLYGKINKRFYRIQIVSPDYKIIEDQKFIEPEILPIYSTTSYLNQKEIRRYVRFTLDEMKGNIQEYLPDIIRKKYRLCEINFALENIHFPKDKEHYKIAKKRLIFDEFFSIQMALFLIKEQNKQQEKGIILKSTLELEKFIQQLPFQLTNAQNRVVEEIKKDFISGKIMNRLVQGDVGSGKTIIAAISLFIAYLNGYQGAMMAPTEILAIQHYVTLEKLYKNFGIRMLLLTGNMKPSEKKESIKKIRKGEVDIVIGTHAIIQENIEFFKLGLVITDEQHRFGVKQRAQLSNKGKNPHIMIMTATPIPRTLSFILYGDLDISIIDELPPGRKKVKTYQISSNLEEKLYSFVKEQIQMGRQAYIVCPLIEESENMEAYSITTLAQKLKKKYFCTEKIELIHGKMKNTQKQEIMQQFKQGNIDILLSTTIIEVGVDVPNASIMVIQNAERFGLAQLHQLRGRIGRGNSQSYCFLVTNKNNEIVNKRMKTMTDTNDGFIIAEKDLMMRGPGDFLGVRQHGLPEFKIANIFRDMNILKMTQKACKEVYEMKEKSTLEEYILKKFEKKLDQVILN
ncbi:ATP-dependent DNA helicase RecG [Garciella nitratireducens]|uniref:ATP-dependent DNA helicase RecG n=1 Tax=Garciella nitratireducens DSM 15102 TaxID=1121911 RepID=A0A1T4JYV8_9FIRM|nr:ATP-dependent DNA helicase RecG [Garciella nitratireducens]SJZ35353.1 ATP-dependent DNA helicase RecG [Garciella nitratireducens DSM 15102]